MTLFHDANLTEKQKEEIDEIALERVRAMNSDEYICQRIDQKVHAMESHLAEYFKLRLAFHLGKSDKK